MSNLQLINAILYVTENGCKWRALPKSYGNWHTVYVRMNRWSKNGVLQRLFEALQIEGSIRIRMEALYLDSTSVKVHPNAKGKQSEYHEADSQRKFICSPHLTDLCNFYFSNKPLIRTPTFPEEQKTCFGALAIPLFAALQYAQAVPPLRIEMGSTISCTGVRGSCICCIKS